MQEIRRFQAVLLAAAFLVGCGDTKEAAARKKLADQIELARRHVGNAVSIVGRPTYIAEETGLTAPETETLTLKPGTAAMAELGEKVPGRANEAGDGYLVKTPDGQDREIPAADVLDAKVLKPGEKDYNAVSYPPYVQDAGTGASSMDDTDVAKAVKKAMDKGKAVEDARVRRAGESLDKARKVLTDALRECAEAPPSTKADARQLLGEIETTRARLLIEAAAAVRARVEDNRTRALEKVAAARDQGITADYHRALGQAPRDRLLKLQKDIQARRDQALAAVKTLDGRIATLTARITQLANENAKLTRDSRKLRAESDLVAGRERLDKVHQAQDLDRKANANTAQADAARDETANLEVDKSLQTDAARDADAELAELAKRLAAMDEDKKRADADTLGASDEAERTAQSAQKFAEEVLQINAEALVLEQEALAALDQATQDFGAAAGDVRTVIQAARSARDGASSGSNSELLEDLADSKHLAMILGSKASTHLMMGDLRSEELSAAAEMAALAKTLADLAGKLGVAEPVVVGKLRDAGKPADKTAAVADYSQAEKDFKTVLSSTLVDKIGTDIKWMYEGRLANAYLGHYRLTGDGSVLGDARAAVAKATKGKNESPYLASVFRLKALIDAVPSN